MISTTQSLRFHPANIWGAGTAAMQTQHLLGLPWHSGSQDLPDPKCSQSQTALPLCWASPGGDWLLWSCRKRFCTWGLRAHDPGREFTGTQSSFFALLPINHVCVWCFLALTRGDVIPMGPGAQSGLERYRFL